MTFVRVFASVVGAVVCDVMFGRRPKMENGMRPNHRHSAHEIFEEAIVHDRARERNYYVFIAMTKRPICWRCAEVIPRAWEVKWKRISDKSENSDDPTQKKSKRNCRHRFHRHTNLRVRARAIVCTMRIPIVSVSYARVASLHRRSTKKKNRWVDVFVRQKHQNMLMHDHRDAAPLTHHNEIKWNRSKHACIVWNWIAAQSWMNGWFSKIDCAIISHSAFQIVLLLRALQLPLGRSGFSCFSWVCKRLRRFSCTNLYLSIENRFSCCAALLWCYALIQSQRRFHVCELRELICCFEWLSRGNVLRLLFFGVRISVCSCLCAWMVCPHTRLRVWWMCEMGAWFNIQHSKNASTIYLTQSIGHSRCMRWQSNANATQKPKWRNDFEQRSQMNLKNK